MTRRAFRLSLAVPSAFLFGAVALMAACGSAPPRSGPAIATVGPSATPVSSRANTAGVAGTGSATAVLSPTPIATDSPTPEPTPAEQTTPVPTSAAVPPLPPVEHLDALALGGGTPVRSAPSMVDGETVATLADQQPIVIQRELRGQRWVVGDQTWAMAIQDWSNLWYQIDGGYVYAGFVYIPRPGELDSLADTSAERWIDIDLTTQTARAMIGDRVVHTVLITSGKPGFETPAGEHTIESWGRKFNETMTSAQAGIKDAADQYNVRNVLYTQYFDTDGDALHLNYWQPEGVFGNQRTSHGCVGLQLHDAEYLWLFARPGMRVVIRPLPPTPKATATAAATPSRTQTAAPKPTSTPARATAPAATRAATAVASRATAAAASPAASSLASTPVAAMPTAPAPTPTLQPASPSATTSPGP